MNTEEADKRNKVSDSLFQPPARFGRLANVVCVSRLVDRNETTDKQLIALAGNVDAQRNYNGDAALFKDFDTFRKKVLALQQPAFN